MLLVGPDGKTPIRQYLAAKGEPVAQRIAETSVTFDQAGETWHLNNPQLLYLMPGIVTRLIENSHLMNQKLRFKNTVLCLKLSA